MEKERVIFRCGFDQYMDCVEYLACFPDDEASPGRIVFVSIEFRNNGGYSIYADEMDMEIFYAKPIVHKGNEMIEKLVDILKECYGGDYQVCEKIMRK